MVGWRRIAVNDGFHPIAAALACKHEEGNPAMHAIVHEAFGLRATGGLHIPAARLWLDGMPRDGIALRSHLARLPARLHRIVCSPELAALMGKRSPQPLLIPWATPLQLGRLTLELLPAGGGPGTAMLRWHLDGRTHLYAAAARPEHLPTARPMELASADVLVLDAELAELPHVSPAALRERVRAQVGASQSGADASVWLFDRRSSALDVAAIISDQLPLYGHRGICLLASRYLAAGVALPRLRQSRRRPPTRKRARYHLVGYGCSQQLRPSACACYTIPLAVLSARIHTALCNEPC